ncbi:hypothetical protein F5Y19DRAFT_465614 [Xylariaceae sp. FL1651]|nr:hypothetical protein F5Y19DRAFT_465614 [Xylariaceae sp. FL1651]
MAAQPLQCHHIVRVAAVAASIVTARHLFANGFHYPLLMLLAHVAIALLVESFGAGDDADKIQRRPATWTSRSWQALFAVVVAVGLVFTYHSMLHNRNTTLSVMLLGLDWTCILGRPGKWLRQDRQHSLHTPFSITTLLLCVALLVWTENWLVEKGIEYLLIAVICIAVARILWDSGVVENPVNFGTIRLDAYTAGITVCLPLSIILLAAAGWYNRRDFHVGGRVLWILINTMAGVVSLLSDASLRRFVSSLQDRVVHYTWWDFDFGSPMFSLLVVAVVEIDNRLAQHRPSTTSGMQWLAFAIAHFTTVDATWMTSSVTLACEKAFYARTPAFKIEEESTVETRSPTLEETEALYLQDCMYISESSWVRHITLAWQAILGSLAVLLILCHAVSTPSVEPRRMSWDLDIVIAWYDEPVEQVVRTAQLALELPTIAGRKTRTIVYNKGPLNETELESMFSTQGDLVIRRLENVGREGETYLSHLLDKDRDWASHTLFLQAEPHEPSYLQARLRDYFIEETGFLSLSSVRNYCLSCNDCNDHSGWTANGTLVRDIFEQSNPHEPCQDISLTYRGQFVVSSHRIKQANSALLRDMRRRLIADEYFGYTLERFWGTIFRCPSVSERCPTLLSGWIGNRAAAGDCQCLDITII